MKALLRKNRVVTKLLIDTRGGTRTDLVRLPPNAFRLTGVTVSAQHQQVKPANAVNRYYFGASDQSAPNPALIAGLSTGILVDTSVDVQGNAAAGQYLYYAHPIWLSNPQFHFGGFTGGFLNVDTEDILTPEGYVTMRVWRTLNANLGSVNLHIVH